MVSELQNVEGDIRFDMKLRGPLTLGVQEIDETLNCLDTKALQNLGLYAEGGVEYEFVAAYC